MYSKEGETTGLKHLFVVDCSLVLLFCPQTDVNDVILGKLIELVVTRQNKLNQVWCINLNTLNMDDCNPVRT